MNRRDFIASAAACIPAVMTGCQSSRPSRVIYDEQFQETSAAALRLAEEIGGLKLKSGTTCTVRWSEGTKAGPSGWKGWPNGAGGIVGGRIDQLGNIEVALTDGQPWLGDPRRRPDVHEMQHLIYYSHGIPADEHHKRMAASGYAIYYD